MQTASDNLMGDRVRARAVWTALLGVAPIVLLVQWSDIQVGGTMTAGPFPPLAACLLWCALLGFQAVVRRAGRTAPLNRPELLIILAVWLAANMAAGRGLLHPLLASLVGPAYFARSGAAARAITQNTPAWLAVTDKAAARDFFEGHGVPVPWSAWRRPLLTWTLFFIPFLSANVCLCALFERVWVRHERLAFPLVALPIEWLNASGRHSPGARRAIAFGLAVPILLHGFGVAHAYAPGIPCIPFFNDLSDLAANPPWNALKPLYLNFYPLLIGLTFLAPTDITFSVWFFLMLNKVELVWTSYAGWNDGGNGGVTSTIPYLEEQSAGAYLALGGVLVWNARRHLRQIVRAMVGRAQEEYRGYGLLAWGFALGVTATLAWCVVTGLPLGFAAGFFGFYLVTALVLARLMAEGGVAWILAPILPDKLILSLTGSGGLSPLVLTRLAFHVQHLRDTRQMLAPAIFETGKLRDAAGYSVLRFYSLLLVAILLALGLGVAIALPKFYAHGAASLAPNSDGLMMATNVIPVTAVSQLSARLLHPIRPSFGGMAGVVAGAMITFLLSALRVRFLWWPLHPLGYALTGTLQTGYANKMLFSIFLGWLLKSLTLRLGGASGYRYLRNVAHRFR